MNKACCTVYCSLPAARLSIHNKASRKTKSAARDVLRYMSLRGSQEPETLGGEWGIEVCFLQYNLDLQQYLQLNSDTCASCIIIVGFLSGSSRQNTETVNAPTWSIKY